MEKLQHANQLKPNQPEVVLVYFEALVRDNQKPAGEKLVRDFINQEKTNGTAYDRLYLHYMVDKRPEEAEQILKLKIENNPKSANYLLSAGGALRHREPAPGDGCGDAKVDR